MGSSSLGERESADRCILHSGSSRSTYALAVSSNVSGAAITQLADLVLYALVV